MTSSRISDWLLADLRLPEGVHGKPEPVPLPGGNFHFGACHTVRGAAAVSPLSGCETEP